MKKRTYGTGTVTQGRRPETWELRYTPKDCGRLSKTIEATSRKDAEDALSEWRKQLDRQQNPGVKIPCFQLFELHLADMRRLGRSARNILDQEKKMRKHLVPFFGNRETAAVTLADINKYIDFRLCQCAKPATINRELANLRRSFNCGVEQHVITDPLPKYRALKEDNVREGFVEEEVYRAMLANLPSHQQMLFCFARYLGIRKGELLEFRWEWLLPFWREDEPIIKIPGRYCKSGKPHTVPIYHPEMKMFVEMALAARDPKCPYVFQFRGKQLKNTRTGWDKARQAAGVPDLIFHDTRRTAIRLMEQAGIPRHEAMQISGHKTESIYKRYDIAAEKGAVEAGKKLRRHFERLEADRVIQKLGEGSGDAVKYQYEAPPTKVRDKRLH